MMILGTRRDIVGLVKREYGYSPRELDADASLTTPEDRICLRNFRKMSASQREATLLRLTKPTKPNGALADLDAEIIEYERRHEISSLDLRRKLRDGTIKETAEIASWLIALNIRDRIK